LTAQLASEKVNFNVEVVEDCLIGSLPSEHPFRKPFENARSLYKVDETRPIISPIGFGEAFGLEGMGPLRHYLI